MKRLLSGLLLLSLLTCQEGKETVRIAPAAENWTHYLGDRGTSQYSALSSIDTGNVNQLQVAWTYASGNPDSLNRSQMQCNPLVIDGILYGTNPRLQAFAIDAVTGEEYWRFDPGNFDESRFWAGVTRGLSYWTNGTQKRIYYPSGGYLLALDAVTGKLVEQFGDGGRLDLHTGLGEGTEDYFVISTSPGIIYKDVIVMGSRVSEDRGAAPGNIRAFDLETGDLRWMFATTPENAQGGANAWSGLSLDEERGIVYTATGSASYDFYGGNRPGNNEYANSILALDAATGELRWHYQTVHHDLWDRDHPAPPILATITKDGNKIDALIQLTKAGYTFVFDRVTGESLFPIEERPFPASDLTGEWTSPTQPIPTLPPPYTRQVLDTNLLFPFDAGDNAAAKAVLEQHRYGGPFLPPSEEGTIIYPGFDGGAEWGGAAFDPASNLLYVNANQIPAIIKMNPVGELASLAPGHATYATACQSCHGEKLEGGGFQSPSILNIGSRYEAEGLGALIKNGKGGMPAFSWMEDETRTELVDWLLTIEEEDDLLPRGESDKEEASGKGDWPYPYIMNGYKRLKTKDGYPISAPPWGTLTALDLSDGTMAWQIPFGEYPDLVAKGIRNTGTPNYGGPVATAGGLLFIAGTPDEKIRAYRARDGVVLWEAKLPHAGYATPAVYSVDGQQYVVVACGGGKLDSKSGDQYVAFTLPAVVGKK